MDLETRNILGYDYLPYMIVVSLEMSDEPYFLPLLITNFAVEIDFHLRLMIPEAANFDKN